MKWAYYIPTTPPLRLNWLWYIGVYRAQQQGYGHLLQLCMSRKVKKEAKPNGENTPPLKDKAQNLNNVSSTYIYLHLNDPD